MKNEETKKIDELIGYIDGLLLTQKLVGGLGLAPDYSKGCIDTLERILGAALAIRSGREIPAIVETEDGAR